MGVQTEQPAAPAPPAQPSRSRVRASWWLIGSAVLAAGLVGGVVGAAVTRGPEQVCDAADVASRGLPSVVTIQASGAQGRGAGTGSGEVIRSDGYILTNDHVITPGTGSGGRLQVLFDDGTTDAGPHRGPRPADRSGRAQGGRRRSERDAASRSARRAA